MKKLAIVSTFVLLGAGPSSFARQTPAFEDAVTMASDGLIVRGTVLDSSTEGKDAPIPRIEPGAQPLLHTAWRVRIDDCYYSAGGNCRDRAGTSIDIRAFTGVAIQREGTLAYEPVITNSATLKVTYPLSPGNSLLLFVRPDKSKPGTYQIVPILIGSQVLAAEEIVVPLRRYELLSEAAKVQPENQELHRRRIAGEPAHHYREKILLQNLSDLIQRVRGNALGVTDAPHAPQLDPQAPQQ